MKIFFIIIGVLLVSCQTNTSKSQDEVIRPPKEFDTIRNEIINLVKEEKTPSFSVAVVQNGSIIWKESFLKTTDSLEFQILPDSQYPIASLSKSITATLIMKLVESGNMSLDDPVEQYLPNKLTFYNKRRYSIRELLNMTAGIPHGWIFLNSNTTFASEASNQDWITKYGISTLPKGTYEYSNYSYGILEAIIEKASGKPYHQVLEEEIFNPLNMVNSYVSSENANKSKFSNPIRDVGNPSIFIPSAGAGTFSNLNDLILYARHNLKEKGKTILNSDLIDSLHYSKTNASSITALGWGSINIDDDTTWLVSNGSFPKSANSNLTIIPEKNIAVICLANKDYQSSADIQAIKIADVLVTGFAKKAFSKIEAYEANNSTPLNTNIMNGNSWEGYIHIGSEKYPMHFTFESDNLYFSFNQNKKQKIQHLNIDAQLILRGSANILVKNPLTEKSETTNGNMNLLLSENKLQGHFSALFRKDNEYDIALPFYIEAEKIN
ncbi:serine hydrolase [uncultured Psychroserpens sp.]|uniref:serine hydrolase domain-containing protein n=1 Tax=uncultured Psychroserpens sp. TaxID=255436 RepID=UPI002637799A|nr:serine hydrolase domain-containing protein [uncultured Psychroserpens sp.]